MVDRIERCQVDEADIMTYVVDASDLGWPPGYFPDNVETDLGNGSKLIWLSSTEEYTRYVQECGCIEVHVYND